jgi:hypothetical protein
VPNPITEWSAVRLYGTYLSPFDGAPLSGSIKLTFNRRVTAASASTPAIFPKGQSITRTLDSLGQMPAVYVPAEDDPDISPHGWTITVEETLSGASGQKYDIVPKLANVTAGINLANTIVPDTAPSVSPVLIKGLAGGVAALDSDGDVVNANGEKVLGALDPDQVDVLAQAVRYVGGELLAPDDTPIVVGAAGATVRISDHGGVSVAVDSDGFPTSGSPTDSTTAVLAAIAALQPGDTLAIDGHYCWHDAQLDIDTDAVMIDSTGGSLICTTTHASTDSDGKRSTVAISGRDVTTTSLVLGVAGVTHRRPSYDYDGSLFITGDNFSGRGITVDGSWQIGIVLSGTTGTILYNPVVRNTRADGIHILGGCVDALVLTPQTFDTGDDGLSMLDYDGSPANTNCRFVGGTVTDAGARGLALMGGAGSFENCTVNGSQAAGMFVSAEAGGTSAGVTKPVRGARFAHCVLNGTNKDPDIQHGAMFLVNYQALGGIRDVRFDDITVGAQPVGGFNGGFAILSSYGAAGVADVYFDRIVADTSRGTEVYLFNGLPDSSYRLTGSKHSDDTAIPDAGTAGVVVGGDGTPISGTPTGETWTATTAYPANRIVIFDGKTYAAKDAHTSGAAFADDLSAHWVLVGVDPATAQQVIVEATQVSYPFTLDGEDGFVVCPGTFVPSGTPTGPWRTNTDALVWEPSGLPAIGTLPGSGLVWTCATSGGPSLGTAQMGGPSDVGVVDVGGGHKGLRVVTDNVGAFMPGNIDAEFGDGPMAVVMRLVDAGVADGIDGQVGYLTWIGTDSTQLKVGLEYTAGLSAGQRLHWWAGDGHTASLTGFTSPGDVSVGAAFTVAFILNGTASKIRAWPSGASADGIDQLTFPASFTPTNVLQFANIDEAETRFRGSYTVTAIALLRQSANTANLAACAAELATL